MDTNNRMTPEEFEQICRETEPPPLPNLWYLSFARTETGQFLGGCFIEAPDFPSAIQTAWDCECNPGGEVKGLLLHQANRHVPDNLRRRLLSRQDLHQLFGETERF